MNDTEMARAVKQTLDRQAHNAPSPNGLLETVRAGSRRRGIRRRLLAGVSGLAVAALAAAVPSVVAQPGAGKPSGSDGVNVCFEIKDNGIPQRLMVAERRDGEIVDSEVGEWNGGSSDEVEHPVAGEGFHVAIKGRDELDRVPAQESPEEISVNGREGVIGYESYEHESGDRIVGFKTGVRTAGVEVVLSVQVVDGSPSDKKLLKWVESIDFSTKPADCGY
ncbi:MAG: hypothetical protein ACRD0P_06490 [Stackebrandtia sp.]